MKILIVDDDKAIRTIASISLRKKGGHEVLCAADGRKALALAESAQPDLVLLDRNLPDMDGLEACRRIRKNDRTKHIPVIFFTAKGNTHETPAGAAGCIRKPFNPLTLPGRIREILGQ